MEERWPSVAALSKEHPGDDVGYDLMADVALAYRRLGNQARSDEAVQTLDRWLKNLDEQGINNFVFSSSLAEFHALNGDVDAALEDLRVAVDGGLSNYGPVVDSWPHLASLEGDPRLAELEEAMLANLNRERAVVGLEPLNSDAN